MVSGRSVLLRQPPFVRPFIHAQVYTLTSAAPSSSSSSSPPAAADAPTRCAAVAGPGRPYRRAAAE